MGVKYLETPIVSFRVTDTVPRYGMTVDGYTCRSGAPTSVMIRLKGSEGIERRVMAWQFSNAATMFVRVLGETFIIRDGTFFRDDS